MKKLEFIQNLIQKNQEHKAEKIRRMEERELNKPKHIIEKLYIGSIIKIEKEWYTYNNNRSRHHWSYIPVKDYAIFEISNNAFSEYNHIASSKCLEIRHWEQEGMYVVDNVEHFYKKLQSFMLKNNLQLTDKLSRRQIIELENELNKNSTLNTAHDNLFDVNI